MQCPYSPRPFVAAQGRLAEVYGGRRTGEVAVFGEGYKVAELA